jgi:hypothetical protein
MCHRERIISILLGPLTHSVEREAAVSNTDAEAWHFPARFSTSTTIYTERSSNFIVPSTSNGCAMACAYCHVPRRKGYANPITVFVNIEQICAAMGRHARRQGLKPAADQVDPKFWVYDLGENGDLSVDALVSDNVRDLAATFATFRTARAASRPSTSIAICSATILKARPVFAFP